MWSGRVPQTDQKSWPDTSGSRLSSPSHPEDARAGPSVPQGWGSGPFGHYVVGEVNVWLRIPSIAREVMPTVEPTDQDLLPPPSGSWRPRSDGACLAGRPFHSFPQKPLEDVRRTNGHDPRLPKRPE